jgi:hypothetical protein
VLEPCEGEGAITRVLRAHGHTVTGYDLARDGIDFLKVATLPSGIGAAITNPPFSRAAEIVRHALELVPKVVILERIQWLESEERAALFCTGTLARVFVFRDRVPRMHRDGWDGKRASAAMCLAWFVFERDHRGPWMGDWIRCRPLAQGA